MGYSLSIDKNASMTKYLTDSKITNAVINKITDNGSRSSEDEDKQLTEVNGSIQKWKNWMEN